MTDNTASMGAYDRLGQFLDRYLHQDFRAEYVTHKAAARAFRANASPVEVAAVLEELETFLAWAETVPTHEWQAVWATLGGRWNPRSIGPLRAMVTSLSGEKRWLPAGERPIRPRRR